MTQDPPLVEFSRRGAGGWLTLDWPARRNAHSLRGLAPALRGAAGLVATVGAPRARRRYDGLLDRALRYQPYPSPPALWCNVQLHSEH